MISHFDHDGDDFAIQHDSACDDFNTGIKAFVYSVFDFSYFHIAILTNECSCCVFKLVLCISDKWLFFNQQILGIVIALKRLN